MKIFKQIDFKRIAYQAMGDYGFEPSFPAIVLKEVQAIKDKISNEENLSLRDLCSLLWSSIDNADSLDLDQIEYCEPLNNKETRVLVAIADVDEHVKQNSHVDQHASLNATSVYTSVQVFPMLPQALSHDLSSLKEGEERKAVVIEFFVCEDGSFRPGEIFRAFVQNKSKLVYDEVGPWLEGISPMPAAIQEIPKLAEQIRIQDKVAQCLYKFRRENGALEFETIEPRAKMEEGKVVDLVVTRKNRARILIENFMVAANGAMGAFLNKKRIPFIQRVLPIPDQWMRIREVAAERGEDLPLEADAIALANFLSSQRKRSPQTFPDLSLTIVKLLGPGQYAMLEGGEKSGHFGLAVQDYTHATAPNRRYVDLIIQRILKAVLQGESFPYPKNELSRLADWCSGKDKAAKKIERFMRKVASAVLLENRIGEVFEGIITGASEKGTYVRLISKPIEGRIVRGQKGLVVGQKLRVRLIQVVPERGYIDFERIGHSPQSLISKRQRKFSQKKFFIFLLSISSLFLLSRAGDAQINTQEQSVSAAKLFLQVEDEKIAQAFEQKLSGVWFKSEGLVEKILADDQEGSRHQRFIVRLSTGQTLLMSHNIDVAPRILDIEVGEKIYFYGRYEWNSQGGVIHWTHHDPQGMHPGGWIEYQGRRYQ